MPTLSKFAARIWPAAIVAIFVMAASSATAAEIGHAVTVEKSVRGIIAGETRLIAQGEAVF